MNIVKYYQSRKYLLRLLLSLLLFIIFLLILSYSAIFYTSERKALNIQQEANEKVLNQVVYNVNYIKNMIDNITVSTFFDNDITALLNAGSLEIYELYPKLMRMEKIVNTNPFLDSLIVYNANTDCYYSTKYTAHCEDDSMKQTVDQYMNSQEIIPKLDFIPMSFEGDIENNDPDFFSYFMYHSNDLASTKNSILIVNIKPDWLLDNINNINKRVGYENSQIIILDQRNNILNAGDVREQNGIIDYVKSHVDPSNHSSYSIEEINQEKKILSYVNSPENGWTVVNVQSYDDVVGHIKDMRLMATLLFIAFLIFAIIGSFIVSHKLYKPVGDVLKQIKQNLIRDDVLESNDELKVISVEYNNALKQMQYLKNNEESNKNLVKTYYLRKLVIDSTLEDLSSHRHHFVIDLSKPMLICTIKIDDYAKYNQTFEENEKKVIEFAISNIAQEIMNRSYPTEFAKMKNDHFIMLLNIEKGQQKERAFTDLLSELQDTIQTFYNISLSLTISSHMTEYTEITEMYLRTLKHSMYRVIYGQKSIILPEMVKENEQNIKLSYPKEIEAKLIEGMKKNNFELIQIQLSELFAHITKVNYDHMMYAVIHTFVLIDRTVHDINRHQVLQSNLDIRVYYERLSQLETLKEIFELLESLTLELCQSRNLDNEEGRRYILVDTVKE
ncbi:hypothetical protein G4V62_07985 [Bacillaceae bacterium SIJ1]|uniref:hypothetical protein n=1 Tax=Litoribacterium kuwaitense TaxID=1398745 RepID=UPI0013EDDFE2|nr:hypothetical protein [Litoribacterium kuwaitense]NGP44901.1 hypothetical protein [Litoribacterium kuwaitense]